MSAPSVPVTRGRVGDRVRRSDGRAKVTGAFAYASDLHADDQLIGVTLRSPHASALIRGIDVAAAPGRTRTSPCWRSTGSAITVNPWPSSPRAISPPRAPPPR